MIHNAFNIDNFYGNQKLQSWGFNNPIVKKQDEEKMKRIELPKLDVAKYVGTKTEIVKAEVKRSKFGLIVLLNTAPIDLKEDDKLPDGKVLSASLILGFNEDHNGNAVIGIDSKMDKFCKAHKIDIAQIPDEINEGDFLKAFEGKKVVCQKSDTGFLTFL